jgi:iron-sulfur cluster assembly protein
VLTLTDQAVAALRELTTQPGPPAETGLRIAPQPSGADGLALSLTDGPQAGDQVIEDAGVHVYVQPDAATALQLAGGRALGTGRRQLKLLHANTSRHRR